MCYTVKNIWRVLSHLIFPASLWTKYYLTLLTLTVGKRRQKVWNINFKLTQLGSCGCRLSDRFVALVQCTPYTFVHGSHSLTPVVISLTSTMKLHLQECSQSHLSRSSSALPWLNVTLSSLERIEVCKTGGTGGNRGLGNIISQAHGENRFPGPLVVVRLWV